MQAPEYKLSSVLAGHEGDVRAVADVNGSQVLTASLDQTAKLWDAGSDGASVVAATFTGHSRYIYSVACLPPSADHPDGLIATASVDTMVNIWSPAIHDGPIVQLVGHELAVCSVRAGPGGIVLSGSWDQTARVWDPLSGSCKAVLKHEHSVLSALATAAGKYITCCADKSIQLWDGDTVVGKMLGHTDVVRDICLIGDGDGDGDGDARLVSCANDGTLRIWDLVSRACLATIQAHNGEYIYSITAIPGSAEHDFATGGEDGTVCVWEDGALAQQITMPAKTVWSVAARPDGDLIVGANDGVARVFSTSPDRQAPTTVLEHFSEHVAQVAAARAQGGGKGGGKIGDLDMKDCKGPEALLVPGAKDGQILLVKDGSAVTAHGWSDSGQRWDLIGEVSGAQNDGNDGIATSNAPPGWRHFDVDLGGGGGNLTCRHKIGDNPYRTAQNFIDENELDQAFLDQIAEFVTTNTDPNEVAPAMAREPEAPAAQAAAPQYFPQPTFVSLGAAKSDGLKKKIAEFNGAVDVETQLSDEALQDLGAALDQIVSGGPKIALVSPILLACDKLLGWPADKRFPGLDALRLLLTRLEFKALLFSAGDSGAVTLSRGSFLKLCMAEAGLVAGTSPASFPSQMLALRCLCNAYDADLGFMQEHAAELVRSLPLLAVASLKKPALLALASLVLNTVVAVREAGRSQGDPQAEVVGDLLALFDTLFEVLSAETDGEVLFRLVVAVGTLVHQDPTASQRVMSMPNLLERIVTKCGSNASEKVAQATEQLASTLTA